MRARRQINVRKQTTLLNGVDVGPPKQRVCWRGLNRSIHEAMNKISNVKIHLKTHSGNVNVKITHCWKSHVTAQILLMAQEFIKLGIDTYGQGLQQQDLLSWVLE